jgi:hypothetical protein
MDQDRNVRHEIQLNCRLRAADQRETWSGMTINVSREGAIIAIRDFGAGSSVPRPGDPVKVELLLPPHPVFGQRCLACEGIASRVKHADPEIILEVQFEQMMFKKVEPAADPVMVSSAVM